MVRCRASQPGGRSASRPLRRLRQAAAALTPALLLLLPTAAAPATAPAAAPVLTTARAVHDLPAAQAARSLPVHLVATITFYDAPGHTLFVEDASGAVFVNSSHPYDPALQAGDLVQIDGVTQESYRTAVAATPTIRILARGQPLVPHPTSYQQLMSGQVDCQYVSIRGIVQSGGLEGDARVGRLANFEVLLPGGTVAVNVKDFRGLDFASLMDSEVQVSGVVGGDFDGRWQLMSSILYSAGTSEIKLLHRPAIRPLDLPLTGIDNIMQTRFVVDQSRRLRLEGTVTSYDPGYSVLIQQGDRSLLALTRQNSPVPLGSVVDLIGFADNRNYGPMLRDAEIFPTGRFAHVAPQPASYADAADGALSDTLITLRGRVLSEEHGELADSLVLLVDGHPVDVVMGTRQQRRIPDVPPGTTIAVTGICRMQQSQSRARPLLFRLEMRGAPDLQLLARPPWWSVRHLLLVVGALFGISMCITAWAVLLRRRVLKQSRQIERSMRIEQQRSRLLEQVNSQTPLDDLLADICTSIEGLAPEFACSCSLVDQRAAHGTPAQPTAAPADSLYEALLTDSRGRSMGVFRATHRHGLPPSPQQRETLAIGTGLANLAVNQRRLYQELNHHSTHDQLTALPNRRLCDARLDRALADAAQQQGRVCVAYIDLDHFKEVNDRYGHKVGDLYLQAIASRLGGAVRPTDLLARIGGDEFLLIATGLHGLEDGEACKQRLQACFNDTFVLDGIRLRGSASIGIAMFPDHGTTAEELRRHADAAMYRAKQEERKERARTPAGAPPEMFSPSEIEAALAARHFRLYYQPQFSPQGRLRGLEALLRLYDPVLGIIPPDAFIGTAERSDAILPLGSWVLRQALADAALWQLPSLPSVKMVVNISARQIEQPDFVEQVVRALADSNIPASILELEITERTLVRHAGYAAEKLSCLRALGVRISLDDFGTEFSSLNMLHRLPLDTLKIDRSFVRAMRTEPAVLCVIEAIVQMARSMSKRIVAEGVETRQDVQTLLALGEMDLQGFAFSRPLSPDQVATHLPAWASGPTTPTGEDAPLATPLRPYALELQDQQPLEIG
ncbi:MAG TPA: EAL domain-containing protein [Acidobacteriaceae bacterium]